VQVLLNKVIAPYRCVRLSFLADKVNCSVAEVERLLASLIVDGRIDGHIDQVNQVLLLSKAFTGNLVAGDHEVPARARPVVLQSWVASLAKMQKTLLLQRSNT
jgi:hypothetical protein